MINNRSEEQASFVRHQDSLAILNTDIDLYKKFKQERQRIFKMDELAQEVQTLQKDIGDIKKMLQQLVNGKQNG